MYKVVCNIAGKLHSAFVNEVKKLDVEYKVGEWVRPNVEGTRLFVFVELGDAYNFIYNISWKTENKGRLEIYSCSVLNPRYDYDKFLKYWKEIRYCDTFKTSQEIIEYAEREHATTKYNSIYAEAVKLHERIV